MITEKELSEFSAKINNLFGLSEQGKKLIDFVSKTLSCKYGCLLFPETDDEDFIVLVHNLKSKDNPLSGLRLSRQNPITSFLEQERKLLPSEVVATLPGLKKKQRNIEKIDLTALGLLVPLISRDRLIGILVLGEKQSGKYSPEDCALLEDIAGRVSVSLEKEYLREQLDRLFSQVQEEARIDGLTGLRNRRSLDEVMTSEINRHTRYGGTFSIIILDLESLKIINDTYGHLVGDGFLKETGNAITQSIRSADQAFRYGGDEFAIVLPNTSLNAAFRVAERIRKHVASSEAAGDTRITASLGLASWPDNGRGAEEVIGAADEALYRAKRNGGNQSQFAEGS